MSTPEKRPTVTVNSMIDISDIDQDGLSQADDEEIISAFTEEYEKRLRNLLTNVDLSFKWERAQGGKPKAYCNCGRIGPNCEHERTSRKRSPSRRRGWTRSRPRWRAQSQRR